MKECLSVLARRFDARANSARLATEVHARAYEIIGSEDPYRELKVRADEVASMVLPRAEQFIEDSTDRLRAALLCSIAGNMMDFGTGKGFDDPEELYRAFDSIVHQDLDVDDVSLLHRLLGEAEKAIYLLDNCGEVLFDKLVVREIRRLGVKVKGVVKGAPILTDVTLEDAERESLGTVFDEILTTGVFAIGLDPERMDESLRSEMENAELIISKGMANFEALSDYDFRPVVYVMRAKCWPVAKAIGARKDDNVVRVYV